MCLCAALLHNSGLQSDQLSSNLVAPSELLLFKLTLTMAVQCFLDFLGAVLEEENIAVHNFVYVITCIKGISIKGRSDLPIVPKGLSTPS